MNFTTTYEANVELQFENKVDPKTDCINQVMAAIEEAISGNHSCAIRGEIEQQVRRAWNEGYKHATKEKELVAAGKSAKALWDMLQKVISDYEQEEFEEAFGVETPGDLICDWDLDSFVERFKQCDKEREVIHVGDEIKWCVKSLYQTEPKEGVFRLGIVLDIKDKYYVVLTSSGSCFYKTTVAIGPNKIQKTFNHFYDFERKEES